VDNNLLIEGSLCSPLIEGGEPFCRPRHSKYPVIICCFNSGANLTAQDAVTSGILSLNFRHSADRLNKETIFSQSPTLLQKPKILLAAKLVVNISYLLWHFVLFLQ
jgi:hypothetical protein